MRCLSCNKILNDVEATRRGVNSGEFLDLCSACFKDTDIEYYDSTTLHESEDVLDHPELCVPYNEEVLYEEDTE